MILNITKEVYLGIKGNYSKIFEKYYKRKSYDLLKY